MPKKKCSTERITMTTFELIQELAHYPADTQVVMAVDWEAPIVSDEYINVQGYPALCFVAQEEQAKARLA